MDLIPTMPKDAIAEARKNAAATVDTQTASYNPLLKLNRKDGEFYVGSNNDPIEKGSRLLLIPSTMLHGWQCWKGGVPIDVNVVPMSQKEPKQDTSVHAPFPGDLDGWKKVVGVTMIRYDTGEKVDYKPMSHGGRSELTRIYMLFLDKLEAGAKECLPVISLDSDSYYDDRFKDTTQRPVFGVEWVNEASAAKLAGAEKKPALEY